MLRHLRASYNPWFIIPFLIWVLIGAILLLTYSKKILFSTVNLHHTPALDVFMSNLTKAGEWGIPVILLSLMIIFKSCRDWWYLLAAIACNALPALIVQGLKFFFNEDRPFKWFEQEGSTDWIHFNPAWGEKLYFHSFPSGHSAGVFSMCCFLSMILPKRYSWLGVALFFFALLVGYTRMYLAAHFYADVFVGSIVGTTTTLFFFVIMRAISKKTFVITRRETRSTLI